MKYDSGGYLIIGQNITKAKRLQDQIVQGSSYLQYKSDISADESLLIDLKLQNTPVLLYTRGSSFLLHQKTKQMNIDVMYLDDDAKNSNHVSSCEAVFSTISSYLSSHESAAVIIDRLDYLIMNYSFETVLRLVYRINSFIKTTQAIFIVRINPDIFTKKQLSLLKEELLLFQESEIEDVSLEESLYQILTFIYEQNQQNVIVSYNKVGSHFGISKVTTGKRILELEQKGFVTISLKGRMKSIYVTKKAEDLLSKRNQENM
jgi:DNA-binding MarR family transcriptional regulator